MADYKPTYLRFPLERQAVNVSLKDIITHLGFVYIGTSTDYRCVNHRVMYFDPKYPEGYYTRHWRINGNFMEVEDRSSEHYR